MRVCDAMDVVAGPRRVAILTFTVIRDGREHEDRRF